jgi:hypothetical protein
MHKGFILGIHNEMTYTNVEMISFSSIQVLSIKITKLKFHKIQKIKPKPNQNRFKPTDFSSIWFSYFILKTKTQPTNFSSVQFLLFYIKNKKLYYFLGFIFLLSNGFYNELSFSSVRLFYIF